MKIAAKGPRRKAMDEEMITVQFCPCGHIAEMAEKEFVELDGGRRQLDDLASGAQLYAPSLSSIYCRQCMAEADDRDARLADMAFETERAQRQMEAEDAELCVCGRPAGDHSYNWSAEGAGTRDGTCTAFKPRAS